jgi:hypothetical protein
MRVMAVRQCALDEGLDETAVDLCTDAAEPKATLIALLIASSTTSANMPARIGALLVGDKGQRATAYDELMALANGDDADRIATATACGTA